MLILQRRALAALRENPGEGLTIDELAAGLDAPAEADTLFHILEHAAANPDHRIARTPGKTAFDARYAWSPPSSS